MARSAPRRSVRRELPSDPEAVATRRRRAAEEPLDVRLRLREPFVELEVRNPIHRTSYRVLFPEHPLRDSAICTCTDFARRGLGTCKHLEAAWSWLEEHHDLPPAPEGATLHRPTAEVWREIDRRLVGLSRSAPSEIRDVEDPGRSLFEGEDEPAKKEVGEGVRRPRAGGPTPRPTSRARP